MPVCFPPDTLCNHCPCRHMICHSRHVSRPCLIIIKLSAPKQPCPHPLQEAGRRVEDQNWRTRPVSLPSFGSTAALSSKGPVTPEQSPVTHSGAPRSPTANGHSAPRFKFGVPSAKFLSFAGPGGDDFARGELHTGLIM